MSAADPVWSVICGPCNCIRSLRLIFVESSQCPAASTMAALVQTLHPGLRYRVGSDPGDGLDSAVGYGFDEGVVVVLVLVGVAGGEVGDGVIDGVVGAEIFGDGDRVA